MRAWAPPWMRGPGQVKGGGEELGDDGAAAFAEEVRMSRAGEPGQDVGHGHALADDWTCSATVPRRARVSTGMAGRGDQRI